MDFLLITTEGELKKISFDNASDFRSKFCSLIGNGCSSVKQMWFLVSHNASGNYLMWLDEEGLLNNQPANEVASYLSRKAYSGETLSGNIIVTMGEEEVITGILDWEMIPLMQEAGRYQYGFLKKQQYKELNEEKEK
mgnify:CR=1 FL=1